MMGSNQHHHDASGPRDERLREALYQLADSAGGTPPLSGAEVRALAGRRRSSWLAVVPAAAVAGLLVGTTAFALTGGFATEPRHTAPTQGTPPPASAPPAPHGSSPSVSGRTRTAPGPTTTAVPSRPPVASAASHAPQLPLPGPTRVAACVTVRGGESLVSLHGLSIPGTLTAGPGAILSAVPLSCARGRLAPSGPPQQLRASPDAAVTTTAPLGNSPASAPSTLEELAVGLARHPDQLFGIRRDTSGRVIRLDEVYVG
jgi:hypothetical protein